MMLKRLNALNALEAFLMVILLLVVFIFLDLLKFRYILSLANSI